jgi:type IV secretion system protein TrbF
MLRFRSKKQIALSPLPGGYSEEDPEKVIFDMGTRLRVDANQHWRTAFFIVGVIAAGAVWTRQPPRSVVKVVGVSADAGGHPIQRELAATSPKIRRCALR